MEKSVVEKAEETVHPKRNSVTVRPVPEKMIKITMEAIQEVLPLPASAKVAAGLGTKPREFNIFGNSNRVKNFAPVRAEKAKKDQEIDIKPIIHKTVAPVKPPQTNSVAE